MPRAKRLRPPRKHAPCAVAAVTHPPKRRETACAERAGRIPGLRRAIFRILAAVLPRGEAPALHGPPFEIVFAKRLPTNRWRDRLPVRLRTLAPREDPWATRLCWRGRAGKRPNQNAPNAAPERKLERKDHKGMAHRRRDLAGGPSARARAPLRPSRASCRWRACAPRCCGLCADPKHFPPARTPALVMLRTRRKRSMPRFLPPSILLFREEPRSC